MRNFVGVVFGGWFIDQFGLWTGYHIFQANSYFQAELYGYSMAAMFGFLFGWGLIFPIAKGIYVKCAERVGAFTKEQRISRSKSLVAAQPIEHVEAMFDRGSDSLYYKGVIDRPYRYETPGGNGPRTAVHFVKFKYEMMRNLAAMPHREREAARILYVLEHENLIDKKTVDALKFALIYGDGRADMDTPHLNNVPHRLATQHQIKSSVDFVKAEAGYTSASMEGAISQLHHLLQQFYADGSNQAVQRLYRRITGGGGFANI